MFPLIMAVCLFFLYEADSYAICLFAGCVVFVLLGLFGSALHYHALFYVGRDSHLALLIGVAYALGLLFQFICNNNRIYIGFMCFVYDDDFCGIG